MARGRAIMKTAAAESNPILSCMAAASEDLRICDLPTAEKETAMEMTARVAVAKEAERTRPNLPKTRSVREMGLERMVSMVPRSFSPAVRSMAGYIAPVIQRMMTM